MEGGVWDRIALRLEYLRKKLLCRVGLVWDSGLDLYPRRLTLANVFKRVVLVTFLGLSLLAAWQIVWLSTQ